MSTHQHRRQAGRKSLAPHKKRMRRIEMLEALTFLGQGASGDITTAAEAVYNFLGSPAAAWLKSRADVLASLASVATGSLAFYSFTVQRPRRMKRLESLEARRVAEISDLKQQVCSISVALLERQVKAATAPISADEMVNARACIDRAVADLSHHTDGQCQGALHAFNAGHLDQSVAICCEGCSIPSRLKASRLPLSPLQPRERLLR